MPIPEQRDLEKARGILAAWFANDLGATDVEVGPIEGPGLTGFSNETLLFDIEYTKRGKRRSEGLVVRVKPTAHTVFLESDFEWQYQVLDILGSKTDLPVPVVRSFEADLALPGFEGEVRGAFIRAPWVSEHGDGVEVLAEVDGHPVAVREGNILAVAFHPEIEGETRLHEWLLAQVAARNGGTP